jgi:VanZ family protein
MLRIQRPSRWLPVVVTLAWAGMIFVLSSRSHVAVTDDPLWDFLTRKAAHVFVFAVLAYLAATAASVLRLPHPAVVGLVIAVAYGAIDELHQGFVVGRSALVADVLIDAVGAVAGATIWWWRERRRAVRLLP